MINLGPPSRNIILNWRCVGFFYYYYYFKYQETKRHQFIILLRMKYEAPIKKYTKIIPFPFFYLFIYFFFFFWGGVFKKL